jgi:class 3 adenylate cyclase
MRWSRADYAAIGPVTNLASRLCDEAKGGQILVSQRVQAATADLAKHDFVSEIAFKGIREPVPVYDVLSLTENSSPA